MAARRITKGELLAAVARFAALATAYADASEDALADDAKLHAALRSIEAVLGEHLRERSAERDARALAAVGTLLRGVYARVLANATGESGADGPSSRHTWHEGAWYTDEQRRAVLERAFERWLPGLAAEDVAYADLTAAQIEERGGPAPASAEIASLLGELAFRKRPPMGTVAAVASTLPEQNAETLTITRMRAFVEEALSEG